MPGKKPKKPTPPTSTAELQEVFETHLPYEIDWLTKHVLTDHHSGQGRDPRCTSKPLGTYHGPGGFPLPVGG
jgi:hypothetical protein